MALIGTYGSSTLQARVRVPALHLPNNAPLCFTVHVFPCASLLRFSELLCFGPHHINIHTHTVDVLLAASSLSLPPLFPLCLLLR